MYVKKILDRQEDDVEYLTMLYKELPEELKEMKVLLLEDLTAIYHNMGNLEAENKLLHEMIQNM